MRRALPLAVLASILLPMTVQITGCSIIGYNVGLSLDRRVLRRPVPRGKAFAFKPGTWVKLGLQGGEPARGVYRGVGLDPLPAYHQRYRDWQATSPVRAPGPGDAVTLVTRAGQRIDATFVAFAYRAIEVETGSEARTIPFEDLTTIERAGVDTVAAETLAGLDATKMLPSRTVLLLENQQASRGRLSKRDAARIDSIPLERVQSLTVGAGKAATTGLVLGLAVDMALVAAVAAMASWQGPFESSSGCSSSGFVYTDARPLERPYDPVLGRELEPQYAQR